MESCPGKGKRAQFSSLSPGVPKVSRSKKMVWNARAGQAQERKPGDRVLETGR